MTIIPFAEALELLDRAFDISVPGYETTASFSLDTAEGAHSFLELSLEDSDNEFFYRFLESANETVKIDGDVMTLVYDDADVDDSPPTLDVQLLSPMALEPAADSFAVPPLVLQALRHVRAHIPEVDRVVFWGDGRWAYMTDAHRVPSFDGHLIDTGLLEDAAGDFPDCYPHAFQLPPEHQ